MASNIRHLGDYIREQRATSQISLRQLAKLAGVSNPYLSQIERGLRKPSAEILQQIAKGLRISAEALYVQAGILEQREGSGAVVEALLADEGLNERQKQVLLEIYDSFRKENASLVLSDAASATLAETSPTEGRPEPEPLPRSTRTRRGRARTATAVADSANPNHDPDDAPGGNA